MENTKDKIKRLTEIARLYYEQDKTQNEIAGIYQISRPLVSRLLKEARKKGIVHIEIRDPVNASQALHTHLKHMFSITGAMIVPNQGNDTTTNELLIQEVFTCMENLRQKHYGIGWGHMIGNLISAMENGKEMPGLAASVCPLLGNSGVSNRNYHSNELVRIFAEKTSASPRYLYAPAMTATEQELNLIRELENYKTISQAWNSLDVALINIGNYPSTPDFASVARYGNTLKEQKAVGRLLNYYFDIHGTVLYSDRDYAIQIPLNILKTVPYIIGIASASVNQKALLGALKTGLFNFLIVPENQLKEALLTGSKANGE